MPGEHPHASTVLATVLGTMSDDDRKATFKRVGAAHRWWQHGGETYWHNIKPTDPLSSATAKLTPAELSAVRESVMAELAQREKGGQIR